MTFAGFEHVDRVEVVWRSFELNPDTPAVRDGDYAARLAAKYGGNFAGGHAMRRMTEAAAQAELEFHLERARPGNSFDAHRLTHLAADCGRQAQVSSG